MSIKSKLQALRSGVSYFGLVCAFSAQYYPAHAGAGTITVKDSAGATQTFDVVTDGSGNFVQKNVICDVAAAANCASVTAGNALLVAPVGGTNTIGAVTPGVIASWGLAPITPGTAPTNALVGGVVYTSTPATLTTGQSVAIQSSARGGVLVGSQYPAGAIPVQASVIGGSAAVTATLATGANVTTYLCTLSVRSNGNAASTGTVVVTGPTTTLSYAHWTAPLATGVGVTEMVYDPCVPASAANINIVVTTPAAGTVGTVSGVLTGYQL